jgi:hypothetical protein
MSDDRPLHERPPGDRPLRERVPRRPPIGPWTPFGPTDQTPLDANAVVAGAEALRTRLEGTRATLEKVRRGGAPPDPPDDRHPRPTEPRRADQLLPFLLIRTYRGDTGARPFDLQANPLFFHQSPDILVTLPVVDDLVVVGRDAFNSTLRGRVVWDTPPNRTYDVWVHVWNLGLAPAFGVRVRAWARAFGQASPGRFLGGRQIDLGDRSSATSHLVVKIGPWQMGNSDALLATAECITDVANGTHDWSQDRHTATRDQWQFSFVPPVQPV